MKQLLLTGILALGCSGYMYAQEMESTNVTEKKPLQVDNFVGVQINGLIRQVLNFNNSNTTTTTPVNPYLLTYNINSRKSGWGLRLGIGYSYSGLKTTNTGVATESDINDLQLRVGIEKAFKLSEKWTTGVGLDFLYNINNDKTVNTATAGDTTTTTTKTTISSFGGGAMAWLRYNLTEHIVIGTETSFYYTSGKETDELDISAPGIPGFPGNSSTSKTNNNVSNGTFSMPVVLYLAVKF